MIKRIRTDMRQEVPDIPLTPELKERLKTQPNLLSERIVSTECNAEPYVNLFDAMLVWHWNDPGQVPAFPVIYGDCIPMFGRAYRGDDFSFVSRVGQQLAFGEQIGWFDPSTCQKPDFPYIRDAIRFRWQIRDFFYLGEMNRPPRWNQMPQVTSIWPFSRDQEITLDAVQAAVWRKLDWNAAQQGKTETTAVVVYFSNITEDTVHATPVLNWEELGLAGKSVRISRVDADGKTPTELTLEDLTKPMDFPARKSWGFLIEVVKQLCGANTASCFAQQHYRLLRRANTTEQLQRTPAPKTRCAVQKPLKKARAPKSTGPPNGFPKGAPSSAQDCGAPAVYGTTIRSRFPLFYSKNRQFTMEARNEERKAFRC